MINFALEINTLQCRLKAAQSELNDFYSGKAYQELLALRDADARYYCRLLAMKELELSKAHAETVSIREQWFEVFEDTEKEHQKEIHSLKSQLAAMEKRALKAEQDRANNRLLVMPYSSNCLPLATKEISSARSGAWISSSVSRCRSLITSLR